MSGAQRIALRWSLAVLVLLATGVRAFAQCALCRSSVAGANDASLANSINLAVLFLFIPPVTIFCAIFYCAYKYRHAFRERPEGMTEEARRR